MNLRHLLIPLAGAWIGIIVLLGIMDLRSSAAGDEILARPDERVAKVFAMMGPRTARQLARYEAQEIFFQQRAFWLRIEVVIGVFLFLGLLFGTGASAGPILISLAMLLLALAQWFGILSHLVGAGRALAFDANDARLGKDYVFLNGIFLGTEALKALLGGAAILSIGSRRSRRKQFREEVYPVYNSDHGHVDR